VPISLVDALSWLVTPAPLSPAATSIPALQGAEEDSERTNADKPTSVFLVKCVCGPDQSLIRHKISWQISFKYSCLCFVRARILGAGRGTSEVAEGHLVFS